MLVSHSRALFVVALYKYCVLEDEKCLLPAPASPAPLRYLTGMETGFHIMGNSENIGSNIIFSSALCHGEKATKRRKKNCSQQNGIIIRCAPSSLSAEGVKNRSPNINSTLNRGKNCLLGNSVVHIIPFRFYIFLFFFLLGFVGSKLFSELGGFGMGRFQIVVVHFL